MKGLLRKKILPAVMICGMSLMLVSGAGCSDPITALVGQRIEIMDAFFNGDLNIREASEALRRIEHGRLLQEDLSSFESYFQTDVERILHYQITVPEITYRDENVITALVQVEWTTEGIPAEEEDTAVCRETAYYSVILEKNENSYKIVQFF